MNLRAIQSHEGMTYETLRDRFRWRIPDRFNLGTACSDAHARDAPAVITETEEGSRVVTTFGDLSRRSDQLALHLKRTGIGRGDRVAVIVPQSEATGVAHLAIWKLGGISVPLASLFGPEAMNYRLRDAGVSAVIAAPENVPKLTGLDRGVPVIETGPNFEAILDRDDPGFPAADTKSDDPAYLIYTSGTTGQPKGALHAHRSLFGHLPGFELYYEFAPLPDDLIWTPADWAWIGGLMDVLVPAWYFGMPVLTAERDFDPSFAVDLMSRHKVTLAFLPPTALKMMRAEGVGTDDLVLRAMFTGGEPLGEELLSWSRENLGVSINEGYGQTECNLVLGNCGSVWPVRPGSMGRPLPGHEVAVLDDEGARLRNEPGQICVKAPDPVMMLGYWNRPDATEEKFRDGWLLTGDLGWEDDDGYFWYLSRKDDVISSMGYRIGPGEIEECLLGHPAVAVCGVIGIDDEIKGQVPAAFVVVRADHVPCDDLAASLQEHVRANLAAHEVPRTVTFVSDLPRTTTGKIKRRALREPPYSPPVTSS